MKFTALSSNTRVFDQNTANTTSPMNKASSHTAPTMQNRGIFSMKDLFIMPIYVYIYRSQQGFGNIDEFSTKITQKQPEYSDGCLLSAYVRADPSRRWISRPKGSMTIPQPGQRRNDGVHFGSRGRTIKRRENGMLHVRFKSLVSANFGWKRSYHLCYTIYSQLSNQ